MKCLKNNQELFVDVTFNDICIEGLELWVAKK